MNSQTDQQLLCDYAGTRSEPAFAELVRRHVDLVYSAALRMVQDPHLAKDVTQGAFLALARNAPQLLDRSVLSGWLHRTVQNLAANVVRADVRRRAREQEAAAMNELLNVESDATWDHIAPHLDAALGELSEPDRDALMLRYFERKSAREMAQTLGVSDEAAQKRVSRAVERLREFFAKRGVTVGAGGLAAVICVNAVQAAPVGLAFTVASAVTVVSGATLTTTATKAIAMSTTAKTAAITALILVAAATVPLAIQHNHAIQLQAENDALQQQLARLSSTPDGLTNRLSRVTLPLAPAGAESNELMQLRGEVQSLRRQLDSLSRAAAQEPKPAATPAAASLPQVLEAPTVALTPPSSWQNTGNATPESALQTIYWAIANHETNAFSRALAWEPDAKTKAEALFAEVPETVRQGFGSPDGVAYTVFSGTSPLSGFAVVTNTIAGDDATVVEQHQYVDGRVRQNTVTLHRFDDGWRVMLGSEGFMRLFDLTLRRAATRN